MRAEKAFVGVAPSALEIGIAPRVNEYITNTQFDIMDKNLRNIGFYTFLGASASEKPWTAFTEITDTVTDAKSIPNDNHPEATDTVISFSEPRGRSQFHIACDILLAGIYGYEEMPRLYPSGPTELVAENFWYADLSTIGRAKTVLFRQEYERFGSNMRLLQAQTLDEIEASGVKPYVARDVRARMAYQRRELAGKLTGETPGNTPLTSGHVAIIGAAMRRCLSERGTEQVTIQRHRDNRPRSEYKTHFFTKYGSTVPFSGSSLPKALGEQAKSRYGELARPYKERDFVKAGEDMWDIVTGFAGTQTIGSGVRALGTVTVATIAAYHSKYADWQRQKNKSTV